MNAQAGLWGGNNPDGRAAAVCALHEATAIYTAGPVVTSLLERAGWPSCGGRLLDPSAGDGAFLVVALQRLGPKPEDWTAIDRVRGYEIHPAAVADAHQRIASTLRDLGWSVDSARIAARRIVTERDFLADPPRERFAVIAANPPYLRFARVPDYFKVLYARLIRSFALGDLLHAFLDRAADMIEAQGRVVLVTSDRWLSNETAADLRAALGERLGIAHLARLDETSCFYRAKTRRANSLPRVHPVEMMLTAKGRSERAITRAPICPEPQMDVDAAALTLGEIAHVRITPWMGPMGVFVLNKEKAAGLSEGDWVPVVDTDDINPHTDELGQPKRMGLRSRRDSEPTGALAAHLIANRYLLPPRAQRAPYWMPPESLTADLDRPSLLVPRIARRLRAIELPAGVQGINHNLSVVTAGSASLDEIRDLLRSQASHDWLVRHAPRLENNFFSITTKLLRRLPVPSRP